MNRRRLLGGMAAGLGAAVFAGAARANPLGCFDAAALAGTPGERLEHHATAADAFVMPTAAEAQAPVGAAMAGVVRRVNLAGGDKAVALTFDLCQTRSPIAGYDGAIVDYLRANAVPATFFPAGAVAGDALGAGRSSLPPTRCSCSATTASTTLIFIPRRPRRSRTRYC
ncbi:MAG: hypothetical protein WDM84_08375 [Bauldia sp.]